MEAKKFKSAVDIWIKILFLIIPLMIAIILILSPKNITFPELIICISPIGLLLWIYFGTYYELRDSHLYCKCGPFFQKNTLR